MNNFLGPFYFLKKYILFKYIFIFDIHVLSFNFVEYHSSSKVTLWVFHSARFAVLLKLSKWIHLYDKLPFMVLSNVSNLFGRFFQCLNATDVNFLVKWNCQTDSFFPQWIFFLSIKLLNLSLCLYKRSFCFHAKRDFSNILVQRKGLRIEASWMLLTLYYLNKWKWKWKTLSTIHTFPCVRPGHLIIDLQFFIKISFVKPCEC